MTLCPAATSSAAWTGRAKPINNVTSTAKARMKMLLMFGSEHVDRRETRLPCDAVPKVNCKADVAGPKGISSAANDCLRAAILDDGRHSELACAVEPNGV